MPARRRTGDPLPNPRASLDERSSDKDDVAYKIKRQRNNDAVKKTRAKSKETANERKRHVELLKKENAEMEAKIEEVRDHIQTLKKLLLSSAKTKDQEEMIQQVIAESDEEQDDDLESVNT